MWINYTKQNPKFRHQKKNERKNRSNKFHRKRDYYGIALLGEPNRDGYAK